MKKISVMLFGVILALGASAQKVVVVRPVPVAPHVVYYSRPYYYNPFFYDGIGYSWYSHPAYYNRPTKMDLKIQDIENDYADRIRSVRADDSLTRHEKKEKIRELKHERGDAVNDLKKTYYKQYEN
jgi:hypothetical protein